MIRCNAMQYNAIQLIQDDTIQYNMYYKHIHI